jgi:hypothetical protein
MFRVRRMRDSYKYQKFQVSHSVCTGMCTDIDSERQDHTNEEGTVRIHRMYRKIRRGKSWLQQSPLIFSVRGGLNLGIVMVQHPVKNANSLVLVVNSS